MAIVAASVVAGSRLLASADDTVAVWTLADDMAAGEAVGVDDLVARRVRFGDDADLERYFTAEDTLPADLELGRAVGAGELLPRSAVAEAGAADLSVLRIAVPDEQVPSTVDGGSVVDVYLAATGPATGTPTGPDAAPADDGPVLEGVTVLEAPPLGDGFSATGTRSLDVAVTEEQTRTWFAARAGLESPTVSVVEVG